MFLMNKEISYPGEESKIIKKVKEINSTMGKIRYQYQSTVFKEQYFREDNFLMTSDNIFLSSNQLITLLETCQNTEDFSKLLNRFKRLANKTQDWFVIFDKLVMRYHEK